MSAVGRLDVASGLLDGVPMMRVEVNGQNINLDLERARAFRIAVNESFDRLERLATAMLAAQTTSKVGAA